MPIPGANALVPGGGAAQQLAVRQSAVQLLDPPILSLSSVLLGRTLVLDDPLNGWTVQPGLAGMGVPPRTLWGDSAPLLDGELTRGDRFDARIVMIPLLLQQPDPTSLRAAERSLVDFLHAGDLALTATYRDGTARTTTGVRYAGGLEGALTPDTYGPWFRRFVIEIRCPDPWFYDLTPSTLTVVAGIATTFFPILPLVLASGRTFGVVQVFNPGAVPSWPVWTITGPATTVTLSDGTNMLTVTATLGAAAQIVVDTRRGQASVYDPATLTSQWPSIGDPSTFWPIRPGNSSLTITCTGSTSATSIRLDFTPAYRTA